MRLDRINFMSKKLLQNSAYRVKPVFKRGMDHSKNPEDLVGVRLLWAKTGQQVIEDNQGVIPLSKLESDAVSYVTKLFTDTSMLEVFKGLGD